MAKININKILEQEWKTLTGSESVRSPFGNETPQIRATALFCDLEEVMFLARQLRHFDLNTYADRYITGGWTVKELLAHAASWANELRREVEGLLHGESFDYFIPYALSVVGPREWNRNEVRKRASNTLDDLFREFEEHCTKLQGLVLPLSEGFLNRPRTFPLSPSGDQQALWRGPLSHLVVIMCSHFRAHFRTIRQWPVLRPAPTTKPSGKRKK